MRMQSFIYICYQIILSAQYITYDNGIYSQYLNTCKNQMIYSQNMVFSDLFARTPQIIITLAQYDTNPAIVEFTFDITSISTTQFSFQIKCLQSTQNIFAFDFYWTAIDDSRIEVINNFNTNMTGLSNKIFTFSHSNINALNGFVSVASFGFKGPIDYSFALQTITLQEVSVSFTANTSNLLSIGFQVVLGTNEAFSPKTVMNSQITNSLFYKNPFLTIPTVNIPLIPISGLSYSNVLNMRISTTQQYLNGQFSYQFQCWGDSLPANISHQLVWLNVANTKTYYPFQLLKMSFTKTYSLTSVQNPWTLCVSEFNQTYTAETTQTMIIPEAVQSLTITYTLSCNIVLLSGVQGSVLYCSTCTPQLKYFSENCSNEINILKYHFIFYQQDQINQQIYLNVTSTGFILYETLYNREGQQNYTLINLQIIY